MICVAEGFIPPAFFIFVINLGRAKEKSRGIIQDSSIKAVIGRNSNFDRKESILENLPAPFFSA